VPPADRNNPQDWRARLALSRHLAGSDQPREALDLLFAALVQNPHALSIHQAIWRALGQLHHPASLVDRYGELTRACGPSISIPTSACAAAYRSTELLCSARTATTGTRSSKKRIAPAQTTPKWKFEGRS